MGENPSLPYPYPSTASLHSSKFYQQLRVQSLILETLKYPGAASYTVQVPEPKEMEDGVALSSRQTTLLETRLLHQLQ